MARMGDGRVWYVASMVKSEGKRPLGGLRRRLKDNIKVGLKEIDWDWWRALMNAVMNLWVP